jgi:hypothetical protein
MLLGLVFRLPGLALPARPCLQARFGRIQSSTGKPVTADLYA